MECANSKCRKKYHLDCLEISVDVFNNYTQEFKRGWMCPECLCARPKRGNSETPIRSLDFKLSSTTPLNSINALRGSQIHVTPTIMDTDTTLLEELRQFRSEMITRMDSQANAITLLLNQFSQTKQELDNVIKVMRVLEEKVDARLTQNSTEMLSKSTPSTNSAEIVSIENNPKSSTKTTNTYAKTLKVNKGGAMKSAVKPVASTSVTDEEASAGSFTVDNDKDSGWTTVRRRKSNRQHREVGVGTNIELKGIQATEKKKFLHVWRLHTETTIEAITDHVRNVCGLDVNIKIDKIKHSTERDYSSFVIGVPESYFDKLNTSDMWPTNAEFSEWFWFRKSTKSITNK
ncbi:hypothetical protein HF086_017540 [Spodoptera exigua]|uniref:Zinc finger PHD-type domain-containing protein n=1 Tax=Spodoptera exigua TaxID=7107 RepID=A0A922N2D7_SPOEX|nr:hypothetical protein HF086_017540 [Spodoptera exigua]